jgi:hypothetical protein
VIIKIAHSSGKLTIPVKKVTTCHLYPFHSHPIPKPNTWMEWFHENFFVETERKDEMVP